MSGVLAVAVLSSAQSNTPAPPAATAPQAVEVGMPILESHSYKEFSSFPQVWAIAQDRHGVMYMGVSGGELAEYDGVSWRKIDVGMDNVRSLTMDDAGTIWIGGNGGFGYLAPDAKAPRATSHCWTRSRKMTVTLPTSGRTLVTPQGIFFRSYEELFRWDGKTMHVWRAPPQSRFQALSAVHGHIYTDENGIGLEEIVGNEFHPVPGGAAYARSIKLFLHSYDDGRMLVTERDGLPSLYDGQKVTPFPTQADDYLKGHKIYTSTLLRNGDLCVTTAQWRRRHPYS